MSRAETSGLNRDEARALAEQEYRRLAELVGTLGADDWCRPTDCAGWDVRTILAHLLGTMQANASMRENVRQLRRSRRHARAHGVSITDALTAVQVTERAQLSGASLVTALTGTWPGALRGRFSVPAPVRRLVTIAAQTPAGKERWSLGYLLEVIYTRDVWMHRIDLARAVGAEPALSAEHDGRIVADIVAEWARRHGEPFRLELTGPAGGTYGHGDGEPRLQLDAVEFCRALSGRVEGQGLLACQVPF